MYQGIRQSVIVPDDPSLPAVWPKQDTTTAEGKSGKTRLLLLKEDVTGVDDLPPETRKFLEEHGIQQVPYQVEVGVDNLTWGESVEWKCSDRSDSQLF